jgi:hypothetical protein
MKTIKYLFIAIGAILIKQNVLQYVNLTFFDNRPFKFEKYNSNKTLQEALDNKYTGHTSIDAIIIDLEKSGAVCFMVPNNLYLVQNYPIKITCVYEINFPSLYTIASYGIHLYGDKAKRLVKTQAVRTPWYKDLM